MESSFKTNLRNLRIEKGITQPDLAKDLHVSNAIISYWETGKREPTLSALIAIANYFNVSLDYLTGLKEY